MANKQRSAVPHHRTRKDHSTETAEDYVEAIADVIARKEVCRVSDLANLFGVSHVTVSRIVNRLQQEGWLNTKPYYPVELTSKGKRLAAESKHRHQVVLEFLLAIGVDLATAEIDSEGIEHHVSKVTLDAMQRFTTRQK
jgi:DtxR family manganese transport transcriptional regulator